MIQEKFYIIPYLLSAAFINLQFADGNRMRQQPHLAIEQDRPHESNVEQNIQRFVEYKLAEKGCAENVRNNVVLMGGGICWRPERH